MFSLVGVALAGGACGGSSPTQDAAHCSAIADAAAPDASSSVPTDEADMNACPAMPVVLTGSVAPGSACQTSLDCVPSCCACSAGSGSALVAWCLGGICTSANEACCAFEAQAPAAICQQ